MGLDLAVRHILPYFLIFELQFRSGDMATEDSAAKCYAVNGIFYLINSQFFCVFPLGQKSWRCRPCKAAGTQKRTGS